MQQILINRNPIFEPLWHTKKRYVVMKGSAGSGKSVDCAQFYIVRLLSEPGRNLLCIRKVYQSNANSTFAELCKAIHNLKLSDVFHITKSPLKITCTNGNEIVFGGMNDDGQREKLKSITVPHGSITDVWIEEATEVSPNDVEIIDDRLRGVLPSPLFYQMRLTFNPVSAQHWIKKRFFDYQDENVMTHHSTYRDNLFCDEAYYQRMERRRILDPEGYRVYGLGEWGETSGLIFQNYEVKDFPQDAQMFDGVRYGQDFGFNHANALLQVGIRDGEIYVIKELVVWEKTTDEIIKFALDWDKTIPMLCDCAEPDRILMWQRAGFLAQGVKKYPGSVKYSIDWLKQRKIYIHPDCVNTIKEISQWRWREDKDGNFTEDPVPVFDDTMAALRYSCFEWIPQEKIKAEYEIPKEHFCFSILQPTPLIDHERTMVL